MRSSVPALFTLVLGVMACASPETPTATAEPLAAPAPLSAPMNDSPAAPAQDAVPVLLELFSSEGCSSCPPADEVLLDFWQTQPIEGAYVIPLEEHVDYWNSLGWPDPFSQSAFTTRQKAYGVVMGLRGAYTPQLVVDGRAELVGSRRGAAEQAVKQALLQPKAKVKISVQGGSVEVAIDHVPEHRAPVHAYLAILEEGLSTAVPRGENAGETLRHAPVVRTLSDLGPVQEGPDVKRANLAIDPAWRRERVRVVAFVQERGPGVVLGAALYGGPL